MSQAGLPLGAPWNSMRRGLSHRYGTRPRRGCVSAAVSPGSHSTRYVMMNARFGAQLEIPLEAQKWSNTRARHAARPAASAADDTINLPATVALSANRARPDHHVRFRYVSWGCLSARNADHGTAS